MRARPWLLSLVLLAACPKPTPPRPVAPSASAPASLPAEDLGEIGLLTVRLAAPSAQTVCVYGGWLCPAGNSVPLLRCSTDGGKRFLPVAVAEERCELLLDAQISSDGSALWFSCTGRDQAPYLVFSDDGGSSFRATEPLFPASDLVSWSFANKQRGIVVLAPTDEQAGVGYVERYTKDGGKSWETLFQIPLESAASFDPELEAGRRPPVPVVPEFALQPFVGSDGGPAFRVTQRSGEPLLSLSWKDIPARCPNSDSATPEVDRKVTLPGVPGL